MALTAGTLWEIRSGGNDLNGAGFYDRDPGTSVDYSDQDAAQADFTNLTTAGAGQTTLTDGDTGGLFTAAMAGNLVYIASGTNFTAGYYEIVTFTDGDNVVLDSSPTPGGAGASGAGKVGGGRATITDAFLEGVTVGDFVYLEAGTYTPGVLTILKDGTVVDPITFEGYNSSRGDNPTGASRPLIQDGGNALNWTGANFWVFKNLRFEVSQVNGFRTGIDSVVRNCKSSQSGAGDGDKGFYLNTRNIIFDCEAENTNGGGGNQGLGIFIFGGDSRVFGCYIHDCKNGILVNTGNQVIEFNIIDCGDEVGGVGIDIAGQSRCTIAYNTLYNCATGLLSSGGSGICFIFGNIFNSCALGAGWTSEVKNNIVDYNNWFGNTADVSNIAKGENATAVDPEFTTPGSDFSLQSGSACIDASVILRLGVG